MKLYRCTLKVQPSKDHPRFFDIQFAYLHVWIYGDNVEDVAERAVTIVEQLPYERAENKESWDETFRVSVRLAGGSERPEFLSGDERAKIVGVALFLHELAIGGDDSSLIDADPP